MGSEMCIRDREDWPHSFDMVSGFEHLMKGKSFNAGDRVLMTTRSGEEQVGQIVHDNGNGTMKILWEKSGKYSSNFPGYRLQKISENMREEVE